MRLSILKTDAVRLH